MKNSACAWFFRKNVVPLHPEKETNAKTLNFQLSTINYQLSTALNYQHSTLNYPGDGFDCLQPRNKMLKTCAASPKQSLVAYFIRNNELSFYFGECQ